MRSHNSILKSLFCDKLCLTVHTLFTQPHASAINMENTRRVRIQRHLLHTSFCSAWASPSIFSRSTFVFQRKTSPKSSQRRRKILWVTGIAYMHPWYNDACFYLQRATQLNNNESLISSQVRVNNFFSQKHFLADSTDMQQRRLSSLSARPATFIFLSDRSNWKTLWCF